MNPLEHPGDDIDRDVWISVVSNPLRREILEILRTVEHPVSIADLAIQLSRRPDGDGADPDWERAQELRVTLHHRHLPKLDYVGLVEFDFTTQMVTMTPEATEPNDERPAERDCVYPDD